MPETRPRKQTSWVGEARAAPELAAFVATVGPLIASAPKGDGHTVLVLPGMGAGDRSTQPLRWFLRRLGYRAEGWGLGTNLGPSERLRAGVAALVDELTVTPGTRISLVGWSLGGVYACAVARRVPGRVRQVITLGSPLGGAPAVPAGIPSTSVYSRSDAIVPWRSSMLPDRPAAENVEVRGSHLGLGHNPQVLLVVADRLAQPPDRWQPFRPPSWARSLFPS